MLGALHVSSVHRVLAAAILPATAEADTAQGKPAEKGAQSRMPAPTNRRSVLGFHPAKPAALPVRRRPAACLARAGRR